MRTSTTWAACLLLIGGASVWSCALDEREVHSSVGAYAPDAGGSTAAEDGVGSTTDPALQGEGPGNCSGEQPCVDMRISGEQGAANQGAVTCPGCSIEGECVAAGEVNPDNPCQVCAPTLDTAGWSSNEGQACDDGLFCTTLDVCVAGSCVGAARECDDGIACNGVTVCVEDQSSCSPSQNQCNDGALCDVQTGTCVMTCEGCVVDGICLPPAMSAAQNPCLLCDPARSTTSLSAAEGQPCGASATGCSGQDTCDAAGECQRNDIEAGTPCGAEVANECDAADTCDGNGQCVARRADNGTLCEDGLFCTIGDQCQGSTCVGGGPRACGDTERCSEDVGQCVCAGCSVNGSCVGAGAPNPANPCQICDPARSATAYSANVGAACGAAATVCSGQDTCDAQGECAPNHLAAGAACGALGPQCDAGDSCDGNGQCVQRVAQDGSPCDDGQFCTNGDTCQGGACRSGAARNCGVNQTCDEGADQCLCGGCLVNGNCFATGALNPGNSCQICNPAQSAIGFVSNAGGSCGSAAAACSAQDTCNAQGQCQANHLPQGTACGAPASGPCDAADSCDGNGQCIARQAANGATCDDGLFCTQGDNCQSGGCVGGGGSPCGARPCDEAGDSCGAGSGDPCTVSSDCASGSCFFRDSDGDTFGDSSDGRCGDTAPAGRVARGGDCCDVAGSAVAAAMFPGQVDFFLDRQTVCPTVSGFNYNCANGDEPEALDGIADFPACGSLSVADCGAFTWSGGVPACGEVSDTEFCGVTDGACTPIFVVTAETQRRCH
jgi:hypothetical protein